MSLDVKKATYLPSTLPFDAVRSLFLAFPLLLLLLIAELQLFWFSGVQISKYGDILDGVLVRERLCSLSFVASENLKIIRNMKAELVIYKECNAAEYRRFCVLLFLQVRSFTVYKMFTAYV